MPRTTKAELVAALESSTAAQWESRNLTKSLQEQMERVGMENEDLKAQIARRPRSRSPKRFPASSSQKQMDVSCKAFFQVKQWQRDQALKERDEKIAELTAENAQKDDQIASLRRGEGPVGEVLAHIDALDNARLNFTRTPEQDAHMAATFAWQTQPVHEMLTRMRKVFSAGEEMARYGGPFLPSTIPARERP
jgi:cell division protein FtsB